MKNKKDKRFPAIITAQSAVKLRKIFLFRVFSAIGSAFGTTRAIIFCLSLFFAVASVFAESYPNRPTAAEMAKIVDLGTECVRGVNERCWATQYQTNPVAYRVAPFTNTTFYLDQNFMGAMASKIRSLVPHYVNPATVYNGTTNIVMLSVTGLWAKLEIGDHTNQFTCIPAIGTNAATYGDNPWRIYIANLQERYKVLNALKICAKLSAKDLWYRQSGHDTYYYNSWSESRTINEAFLLADSWEQSGVAGTHESAAKKPDADERVSMGMYATTGNLFWATSSALSNRTCKASIYLRAARVFDPGGPWTDDFYGMNITTSSFSIVKEEEFNGGGTIRFYLPNVPGLLHPTVEPEHGGWSGRGWQFDKSYTFVDWQFNYCTTPL